MTTLATPAPSLSHASLNSIPAIVAALQSVGYICTEQMATAIHIAHHLRKPILVEGPAGVGKTDLAQSLAKALDYGLIRLQCYEGLDESKALYEWKYGKQLLYTQVLKDKIDEVLDGAQGLQESIKRLNSFDDVFFSRDFLEPRPLLKAMEQTGGSVLLIDEIDKSDEEFEALLLEILSEYQISVPEIGTIRAQVPPLVLLTSNNARELGDALKRRCLHLHIGFPDAAREASILKARVPDVTESLLMQLVAFVQSLRTQDLRKSPSISETIDWARTLMLLHAKSLDQRVVRDTLNVLLKHQIDIESLENKVDKLTRQAIQAADGAAS